MIFFIGLSALIGAVLNVRGHFAAPMWAPILNNIVVIAACGVFIVAFGDAKALQPRADHARADPADRRRRRCSAWSRRPPGCSPALRKVGFALEVALGPRSLGLRELGGLAGWMLCYVAANQVGVFVVVKLLNGVTAGERQRRSD